MINSNDIYPRPDFERTKLQWQSLNGTWNFAFDDNDEGLSQGWYNTGLPQPLHRSIQVPFAFQTPASKVHERKVHEVLWYERTISDIRTDASRKSSRLLARFGAVDYEATVWVNGRYVASHRGGHVPFDVDITKAIEEGPSKNGQHSLAVRVFDSASDLTQPRGKQYWKPDSESIWYAPTSGIWQSIWLETVPSTRVGDGSYGTILRSGGSKNELLLAKVGIVDGNVSENYSVDVEVSYEGSLIRKSDKVEIAHDRDYANVTVDLRLTSEEASKFAAGKTDEKSQQISNGHVLLWSPETPHLYDVVLNLYRGSEHIDEVKTVFGARSIEWLTEDRTWRLNGQPYFQMLVLDQGYWPETGLTPPTPEHLKKDIELSKAMGFNGCRKHQKAEDPIFLYWADRLGYIVWGEMANAYEFDDMYVERFNQEWMDAVKRDINHPCVVTWTPGNESWGYPDLKGDAKQRNHLRSLYYLTKTLDPTRPINDNCGWQHVCTDLSTFHDYSDGPELAKICSTWDGVMAPKADHDVFVDPLPDDPGARPSPKAPIICTEFGGVNIAAGKTSGAKDWGYTTASDPEDLLKRIERLVQAVTDGGWCAGFVYTQLTDIEQEVNGLYTPNREPKLDVTKLNAIMKNAEKSYYQKHARTGHPSS